LHQTKLHLTKGLFALTVFAGTTRAVTAQDSTDAEKPAAVMVTNGIERERQPGPVVLPNPSCPLTPSQLNAV
jgi:hypothetical protein